jgi:glutamate synthase (NADPH/NADH)
MSSSVSLTFTTLNNPQINAISNPNSRLRPLTRVRSTVARCSATCVERKSFLGTKLRRSGTERIQFWESGGLGRLPKLRVATVKSSFSAVPEKPMGLYDPAFDKDSCGVGFVAELNGQSNRKTVRDFFILFFMFYSTDTSDRRHMTLIGIFEFISVLTDIFKF